MIDLIIIGIILFTFSLLFLGILLIALSGFHRLRFRQYILDDNYRPKISLITPAYNEDNVIERTIKKFLQTTYPDDKKEMIIVNDGSGDNTKKIVEKYASRIIYPEIGMELRNPNNKGNIILIDRVKGGTGKSYALNDGKKYASGDILFFIDADVQLGRDALENAARHFIDNGVGAVAGYIALSENKSMLNKFIDFEFLIGQKLMRRGFNVLGVHYVIPGGCGIFSRTTMDKIGDYHNDTLAEDTDVTWRVVTEARSKAHFDPSIHAKVDEPTTLQALWNQRIRWARGSLEVTWKHRGKVGKLEYGRAVNSCYPFWISSMILPFALIMGAVALLIANMININMDLLPILTRILAIGFFTTWTVGSILNKGKAIWAGLLTPGIVILITITSMFIWENGIIGLVNYLGFPQFSFIVGSIVVGWILLAMPATYLCIRLEKHRPRLARFIQLGLVGYWMFLITALFHGYIAELRKEKHVWVRTVR